MKTKQTKKKSGSHLNSFPASVQPFSYLISGTSVHISNTFSSLHLCACACASATNHYFSWSPCFHFSLLYTILITAGRVLY
jgi:hypothetical protein